MTDLQPTAIVVGGGPAGLACACLLALENIRTALVAPAAVIDQRTTALMDPAIRMLRYLGVWPGTIQQHAAPLRHLHLVDDTGNTLTAPRLEFSATELDLETFGYNVPLSELVPALRLRAIELGVTIIEASAETCSTSGDHVTVTASDGHSLTGKVVIAADGANSTIRSSAGIEVEVTSFDQSALVTSFAHSASHNSVSTEYHKSAGPFTTVPLPGNRSSLVWMDRPARIAQLLELSDADLAAEIQLETHGALGRVSNVGTRAAYAMRGQRAKTFGKNRVMLIGEAAHQMPPIGAQGLNLSLRDAAHAADLVLAHAEDPGADAVLAAYDTLRQPDVNPRIFAVNMMNATLLTDFLPATFVRVAGLTAAGLVPMLRQQIMRQGLSPQTNLPFAMRTG